MRADTYQRRLDAVTDYIYAHLDGDLDLDVLARVSGFSPYHWHRIYRAVRGETAARTVRRLRLERAAAMLRQTSLPLGRIAGRTGFSSADVLARAFTRTYGLTPGRFRAGGHGPSLPSRVPHAASGTLTIPTPALFPVTVQERPGLRLAVAEHRGSYMDIGRAFARVTDRLGERARLLAVYEDDPDAVDAPLLRSAAGTPVEPGEQVPAGLRLRLLPAGRYAVMRYVGPYSSMHDAYLWLYGQWLPPSGEEPRDHPVVEEYLSDPVTTPPARAVTDVLLPLR